MRNEQFNKPFYEADDIAYEKVSPILTDILKDKGYEVTSTKTKDGDRVDMLMTVTKNDLNIDYTIEIKNRENNYTFSSFWNAEEKNKYPLGQGILIKQKKINALIQRSEGRRAYYLVNFPDNILAMWRINNDTTFGDIDLYYDKYNVHRGEKELQHNKTLKLHNADFIYDYYNKMDITNNTK